MASAFPGVEALLRSELEASLRGKIRFGASPRSDEFHFTTSGNTRRLGDLRLCQAIHLKAEVVEDVSLVPPVSRLPTSKGW